MQYNLINVLIMVLTTFIFVVVITPLIKRLAFHLNALDRPNSRKVHTKEMPKLGGLAIFLGFLLGYMLFANPTIEMNAILIGSFIIILIGIFDDVKNLKPRYQFIAQIVAALIIVFYGNLLLDDLNAFGFHLSFGMFTYPVTILFILVMINSIKLIDGLDGLAAGIGSIFFLTIGIIAFMLNKLGGLDIVLSFIMLGSTLGFLVHNFYPAKIYMGETGSMFLGFIISVIALIGLKKVTLTSFVIPLLILAVPLLDTAFAILRRLINKKAIYQADKQHIHHQLLKMNFSHPVTVLIIYYINILFAFSSIVYFLKDSQTGIYIYISLLAIVLWFVVTTNIVVKKKKLRFKKKYFKKERK